MNNYQIVKRPPDYVQYGYGLKDCWTNIWKGSEIIYRFYNQGYWHENNIHRALEEIKWVPEKDRMYKCWWYSTNPADPADPGEDILLYVEEYDKCCDKSVLQIDVLNQILKLDDNKLLRVKEYIERL